MNLQEEFSLVDTRFDDNNKKITPGKSRKPKAPKLTDAQIAVLRAEAEIGKELKKKLKQTDNVEQNIAVQAEPQAEAETIAVIEKEDVKAAKKEAINQENVEKEEIRQEIVFTKAQKQVILKVEPKKEAKKMEKEININEEKLVEAAVDRMATEIKIVSKTKKEKKVRPVNKIVIKLPAYTWMALIFTVATLGLLALSIIMNIKICQAINDIRMTHVAFVLAGYLATAITAGFFALFLTRNLKNKNK